MSEKNTLLSVISNNETELLLFLVLSFFDVFDIVNDISSSIILELFFNFDKNEVDCSVLTCEFILCFPLINIFKLLFSSLS